MNKIIVGTFIATLAFTQTLLAETIIRVEGIEAHRAEKALSALEGRLTYVRSRPAAPSRADDAAYMLKRHLELKGYNKADVDWTLPGDGSILLSVNKGTRYTLGKLHISSGEETTDDYKSYFLQPFIKRQTLEQDSYPYLIEDVEAGNENLRNYLRSQGYWEAKALLVSQSFHPESKSADLSIQLQKGPLYTVAEPQVTITDNSTPPGLEERLRKLVGQPATSENLNAVRARVDDAFTRLGYPYLKMSVQQENANAHSKLIFTVTTGKRFNVGSITVVGDDLTKNSRIKNRFKSLRDQPFDRDETTGPINKLLGTGAFRSIQLDEEPRENGQVDLTLRVDEAKPYGISAYSGFGSLEGFILGTGFYNRNVFGELWNLNAGLEYSDLGTLGEISISDPFFLETDLRFTPRAFITTREYDSYRKFQSGIEAKLDWQVNKYYDITFGYGLTYTETEEEGSLPVSELGIQDYVVNSIGLRQMYDRRNDIAVPTAGYILELDSQLGLASGDRNISFISNEFRASYYHKIGENNHLALGSRLGAIKPLGDSARLPIDLRFFTGGSNSVRSFSERELGPRSTNNQERGGQSYFLANAEYIHHIAGPAKGVLFFDAGGLSRESSKFGLDDPKYALGLGLRLDLPIGPVRFEYGFALNPDQNDPSGAFHFAIGSAF